MYVKLSLCLCMRILYSHLCSEMKATKHTLAQMLPLAYSFLIRMDRKRSVTLHLHTHTHMSVPQEVTIYMLS